MTQTTIGNGRADQELFASDISDEALEAAAITASVNAKNYTLAACSGLSVCPA